MDMQLLSLIVSALGFEEWSSNPGLTVKILNSQSPEDCFWLPVVLVFAFLTDFSVREDTLTPIEAFKPVLESCSGLPCFSFRTFLVVGENWSSTKRFMGAISPTYFVSPKWGGECFFKLSDQLHSQQSLVEEPHWSLPHLLLRGNVCTGSGLSAETHFHHKSCVSCAYSHSTH